MRYNVKIQNPKLASRPTTDIFIAGTKILGIDINDGWEITEVEFDSGVPASEIDNLVVQITKRKHVGDLR